MFGLVTKSADSLIFVLEVSFFPSPENESREQLIETLPEFEEVLYFDEGYDIDRCGPSEELCLSQ